MAGVRWSVTGRSGWAGRPWVRVAALATAWIAASRGAVAQESLPRATPAERAKAGVVDEELEAVPDVTTRYRFLERYAPRTMATPPPGSIKQSRVALRLTTRRAVDRPEGAPERSEGVLRLIYNERPYEVSLSGIATSVVRRFEAMQISVSPRTLKEEDPPVKEGLTVFYEHRPGRTPRVLSLVPGRRLQAFEYQANRSSVFLPLLAQILPSTPLRLGDSWQLPRSGVSALLGESQVRGDDLRGQLVEMRRSRRNGDYVATLRVLGQIINSGGATAINAEILFRFPSPEATNAAAKARQPEGQVEARGGITELRMAVTSTVAIAGGDPGAARLKQTDTRELVLARELASGDLALALPEQPPQPTEENSWINFIDPANRFQFRYPQDFQFANTSTADAIELIDLARGGPDVIRILPEAGELDPEAKRKQLVADWEKQGVQVIPGPYGWLPEEEWPEKKVYRIEAAVRAGGGAGRAPTTRVTFDAYVVKTRQKGTLYAEAYTPKDPPLPFRRQVEDILRTFAYSSPDAPAAP